MKYIKTFIKFSIIYNPCILNGICVFIALSPVMGSTLEVAEHVTRRLAAPLASKLGRPLNALDHTLMASLDKIENTIPVVRDTPNDIIRRTEQAISALKLISVQKTNNALATTGGVRALETLDAASDRAMTFLDHYLPPHESEKENEAVFIAEQEKPKEGLDRAVYAVGKVSRTVTDRLHGKAQRAIPSAICSLGLAAQLESLNVKVQEIKNQSESKKTQVLDVQDTPEHQTE